MTTREIDAVKAEAFGGRMVGMLNEAALSLVVSVGHQSGLFDTLARIAAATSEEVAAAADLNERYVREWLAAMTAGRFVEYDPATRRFSLPPEHAALLTRAAGPGNLAFYTQYIAETGKIEQELLASFRGGGGVPYGSFTRFQQLQREETAAVYDATLIDVTLPLVPGLIERLEAGADVSDWGCGAGHAINLMAARFPNSRFTGYDFSEEGITAGRAEASALGLTNVRFDEKDVARMDCTAAFDVITAFDTVHDQARPATVLRNIARALRPGGIFLMQDIAASSALEENLDHPFAPFLYAASLLHCMTVSLAQGGDGLGTMWGEQRARSMLGEAGFSGIEIRRVDGDVLNQYYICTRA